MGRRFTRDGTSNRQAAKTKASGLFGILFRMVGATEQAGSPEPMGSPTIEKRILVVRECHVILDQDLAELYGVETRTLVQQVRRNAKRFPGDFMFQLSSSEFNDLKSQFVISSGQHGGRRSRPLVFTEQGIAMLSGVLRSERAITVNIEIMRAFVELRRAATSYAAIEKRLEELERGVGARLGQHDEQLSQIFKALRHLITSPPRKKKGPVGFRLPEGEE